MLILSFVLLLAADLWGVAEVWRLIFDRSHRGGVEFWEVFTTVVLFEVGLIWLTFWVGRRVFPRFASAESEIDF